MGPKAIVFLSPAFDFLACIIQRKEPIHVQTLIPEAPVERLNIRNIGRFSGSGEVQGYLMVIGPFIQRFGNKLTAVIYLNTFGEKPAVSRLIHKRLSAWELSAGSTSSHGNGFAPALVFRVPIETLLGCGFKRSNYL